MPIKKLNNYKLYIWKNSSNKIFYTSIFISINYNLKLVLILTTFNFNNPRFQFSLLILIQLYFLSFIIVTHVLITSLNWLNYCIKLVQVLSCPWCIAFNASHVAQHGNFARPCSIVISLFNRDKAVATYPWWSNQSLTIFEIRET